MAKDLKEHVIDDFVWNELAKVDFKDSKQEFSETRGISIGEESWEVVMNSYLAREEVRRAPLAYVTKLVLIYVRQKLQKGKRIENSKIFTEVESVTNEKEKKSLETDCDVKLGDLNADEVSRLVRLNRYLNLLIHIDPASMEKIYKKDKILMED